MNIEYKIVRDRGDIVACDSCNCEAPLCGFEWGPPFNETHDRPKRLLCEFCATTMAGNVTRFQSRDETTALRKEIWRAAASVYNMLKHPPEPA